MTNEKDLPKIKFKLLQVTEEEENSLILKREKFDAIVSILDIPAAARTNQHKRILRQHCFTLLFSSITYGEDIVAKMDCPDLIDIQDEKFGTPLIYALNIQQFAVAKSLLNHTKQYINFVFRGNTALSYAALQGQTDLERAIIEKGGIIPGLELIPDKTPSEIRDELISGFMQNKLFFDGIQNDSPLEKFLNFCRIDNKGIKFPQSYLEDLCLADKTLFMLMILTAYIHEKRNTRVFFCDYKHREILLLSCSETDAFVESVNKNIFVFYTDIISSESIASLVHECAHLVIDFTYDNFYLPYNTAENEGAFLKIVDIVAKKLLSFIEDFYNLLPSPDDKYLFFVFNAAYKDYAMLEWPKELIVRVPEFLAMPNLQERSVLLQRHFPELFDFYYQETVPKMYDFILSNLLKINLAGKSRSFLLIHEQIKRMLCDNVSDEECLYSLQTHIDELSVEEAAQLREITLLLDYKTVTAVLNEHILKKEEQQQREERIQTNISILNTLKLNLYRGACNDTYGYWGRLVEYGGGFRRGEHRLPYRIAHIFDAIEALTPAHGPETRAPDCPPAALLETIHRASEEPSQSWASFFGHKNRAIERLKEEVIQLKSHYQAPNH